MSTSIFFDFASSSSSRVTKMAGCLFLTWSFLDFSLYASNYVFSLAGYLNIITWFFYPTICIFRYDLSGNFAHFNCTASDFTLIVFNFMRTCTDYTLYSSISILFQIIMAYICATQIYRIWSNFPILFDYFENLPKFNFLEHNLATSLPVPTIITMVDSLLVIDSKRSSSQPLLISQWGTIFYCIPVDNSIFWQNNFIFPSLRYVTSDILYTFNLCQRSKVSIPVTRTSTTLAALISIFE